MIARFGSTEIKAILWPRLPWGVKRLTEHRVITNMMVVSDFSRLRPQSQRFWLRYARTSFELDVLGSWRREDSLLATPRARDEMPLPALEPYLSTSLVRDSGRRSVLVIHPFKRTIETQYHNHRHKLFADGRVLPKFGSLEAIQAVQTIAGNKSQFSDWFEALNSMKSAMDAMNYDIAIIGCGAYGFPLAAHAKRRGKQAVHLGGATQILFESEEIAGIGILGFHAFITNGGSGRRPRKGCDGADRVENAC